MFDRELLEQMFESAAAAGRDIHGPLLWGFYFVDRDGHRLDAAGKRLARMGYTHLGVFEVDGDDPENDDLFLHVERVEHHTLESLEQRNRDLAAFAAEHGLDSYDGMDVGALPDS